MMDKGSALLTHAHVVRGYSPAVPSSPLGLELLCSEDGEILQLGMH